MVEISAVDIAADSLLADIISESDPLMSSPLFDLATPITSPTVVSLPESVESSKLIPDKTFHDTDEYIDHAIDEVSDLIDGIDAEDATTLAAQDQHRQQKEHFAELEIADEATHQKHLAERAHAEKMRKYLEHEQANEGKKEKILEPA